VQKEALLFGLYSLLKYVSDWRMRVSVPAKIVKLIVDKYFGIPFYV
jgi:hypothetical protein